MAFLDSLLLVSFDASDTSEEVKADLVGGELYGPLSHCGRRHFTFTFTSLEWVKGKQMEQILCCKMVGNFRWVDLFIRSGSISLDGPHVSTHYLTSEVVDTRIFLCPFPKIAPAKKLESKHFCYLYSTQFTLYIFPICHRTFSHFHLSPAKTHNVVSFYWRAIRPNEDLSFLIFISSD